MLVAKRSVLLVVSYWKKSIWRSSAPAVASGFFLENRPRVRLPWSEAGVSELPKLLQNCSESCAPCAWPTLPPLIWPTLPLAWAAIRASKKRLPEADPSKGANAPLIKAFCRKSRRLAHISTSRPLEWPVRRNEFSTYDLGG